MSRHMAEADGKTGGADGWETVRSALFSGAVPPSGLEPGPGAPSPADLEAALAACAPAAALPARRKKLLKGLACLWHGHWEQAHQAAQDHEGDADFDLLHALVHLREGDHANAVYWFGQAGKHPGYAALARALQAGEYLAFARQVLDG